MVQPRHEQFVFNPLRLQRVETMMANPFIRETQHRWGLHCQTRLCAFRFESDGKSNTSGSAVAGHLRFSGFHKGLLHEFLCSLFNEPVVQEALSLRAASEKVVCNRIEYDNLTCGWTTLQPFTTRLSEAGVVRRIVTQTDENNKKNDEDTTPTFDGVRMPVVKRCETYLPHDIAIADELRALFLLAHNSAVCRGDDDDACDHDDMFGYGAGDHISTAALASVFDKAERAEFLYHILWRLVAGGGTNNQWDDELTVYLEAARTWYKGLVSIRAIPPPPPPPAAGAAAGMDEVDRVEEEIDGTLVPEVVSTVVSVRAVDGVVLFRRGDGAEPSNLNYCYVCIDPLQATVVVWYHCV